MRRADENPSHLWVELSNEEIHALNSRWALTPFDPEYWAPRLGFSTGQALEAEAERLTAAVFAREPMPYDDWCAAIDLINGLMSPRDSEWQTVNGITYLETATALVSIVRKVDLAFGDTFMNPAIGPNPKRSEANNRPSGDRAARRRRARSDRCSHKEGCYTKRR